LSELKSFNLFEGEVVVCEGFNDTNARFNVNRIYKPMPDAKPLHDFGFLKKCRDDQKSKALQIVVAAGPFTTNDSLAYDALGDLLETVRRDKPHTLVLMGPFLDVANQAIEGGDISFKNPATQAVQYLDYDELFHTLLSYIRDELDADKLATKVVLIPSHKEIHHPYPMPCPPFKDIQMPRGFEPVLLGNPSVFRVNDITFGVINADAIKDVCLNMIIAKDQEAPPGGKISLAFQAMLQQRNFFPLLPGSEKMPIDYEQWRQFQMSTVPDILIVPAEIKNTAEVSFE